MSVRTPGSNDALAYLFGLEQIGIKFGLENIAALCAALDHPERAYRTIHVAGTNGKGSVTAMIDTALRAAGLRTARYTSPHLMQLNERFVIGGRPVAPAALSDAADHVRERILRLRANGTLRADPTFFEATTAIAFELFRRAAVDVAVVEVGLGGRLDATNVVAPDVTAITSIAVDHEQFLGGTLREIAAEKAGIIKPGVPIVVGRVSAEPAAAIEAIAGDRGAPLYYAWEGASAASAGGGRIRFRTRSRDYGEVALALRGTHQIDNAMVAIKVLELCGTNAGAIVNGLEHVWWPGRLDVRRTPDGLEAILDAAHNPAGAAALASYLEERAGPPPPLVFGVMRDKDIDGMFRALLPAVGALLVTRAPSPRGSDPSMLAERARAIRPALPVGVHASPLDALAAAWRLAPTIVVAGSIFLLGDAMREIEVRGGPVAMGGPAGT